VDRIVEAHELEPIAYQEAGQAVMAVFEGVPVHPVRIEPEMAEQGGRRCIYCAHPPDWADPYSEKFSARAGREWFEKRMVVTFAGGIAERLHRGEKESGTEVDWEQARMVAVGFWSGERVIQSWLRWLYARAEEVMEEPYAWETVRTLAIELLNRRMLHRRALASLIQETYRRQIPDVGGLLTYVPPLTS
jgi:hypothetical protein